MFEVEFSKAPPVVSKRNDFNCADDLVADAVIQLPEKYRDEKFHPWLVRYTENVIHRVSRSFAVAAERGVRQAADLLCDPNFYETRRKRRANWKKQMLEQKAAQEWDRLERVHCPTAEQIAKEIAHLEKSVADYELYLERAKNRLDVLRDMRPKNIRLMPKSAKN